jgi:hypothetical protein
MAIWSSEPTSHKVGIENQSLDRGHSSMAGTQPSMAGNSRYASSPDHVYGAIDIQSAFTLA